MNITLSRPNGHLAPSRVDLFSEISKELDHAMNNIFGHDFFAGLSKKGRGYPLMDAIRNENELILQYSVPGVMVEDLNVEITEDNDNTYLLTVSGFLHEDYVSNENNYQIRELSGQEFRRIIRLPKDIDAKEPETTLSNGILVVKFKCLSKTSVKNPKTKKLDVKLI